MRHLVRAFAMLAASSLLLAAGEAPNGDLRFLDELPTAPAAFTPAIEIIDETPEFAEPAIGPVLPEARTLGELVAAVRQLDGLTLDRQTECLATAVYFESKGEPLEGQLAVAQVILNRVEAGRFGDSVCDVVTAPGQFSFVRGGQMPNPRIQANWATARAIAVIATAEAWREIVPDATHFHAVYVNPGWRMRRVATVGRHIFYR
ncbi:MAG: cell wall hydrolase [Sphingomonadaceae bacterium]